MKKYIPVLAILSIVGLALSCTKKTDISGTYSGTEGLSYVKVIHAAPSFRQVTNAYRDSFNIFSNDLKVNGTFLTYNSIFPAGNPYYAVPAGAQSMRIALQGSALNPDSVTLASFNKTLVAGAYYSFIVTDSLLKGNDARQMFISDNFAVTDTTHFTLRFVHAIMDASGETVDIFSTLYNTNIFSNIAPGMVTPFSPFLYTVATDILIVKKAGTQTELARLTGATFAKTHAYTIVYKGYGNVITTGTKGRSLIQYTNL